MPVTDEHELLEYALDHLRGQAYRSFVHVSKSGRVIAYQATRPDRDGDLDLAAALRAALAARPRPDVDLTELCDHCPYDPEAVAGSVTPTGDDDE